MTKTFKQMEQLKELQKNLWNVCCSFWGKMTSDDYKDYVLGLLFYRYLSERIESEASSLLAEDNLTYTEAWEIEDIREALTEELISITGFLIEPKYLFSKMYNMINIEKSGFDIQYLQQAISSLEESTLGQESEESFANLFDEMDLNSTKLGKSIPERTALISKAITSIGNINFKYDDAEIDVLGDAYEYLIGQFAASAGKKSGSFYTPAIVGELMAKITTHGRKKILNVYDGCGGSASLLLALKKQPGVDITNYYYQELTTTTYNLARMNMILHGVKYQYAHMKNDDTLLKPAYLDIEKDIIVANPPYSQGWEASPELINDERFSSYGVLAPKSKADYAFILTMLHSLKEDGTMAVVLPHGVLFRGGTEEKIRKTLIEKNYIDAIIGLPANTFYGTTIPTLIMILKKNRENKDVLFIDASREFEKGKNKNYIREQDIAKIFDTYIERKEIEKYSHNATFEEIEKNGFNLNIPRYVDCFEEEEPVDIDVKFKNLEECIAKSKELDIKLEGYFKELGLDCKNLFKSKDGE